MNAFARATLTLLPLLVVLPAVAGQDVDMDYQAVSKAAAGSWADYTLTVKNPKKPEPPGKMRYTLTGKGDNWMVMEIDTSSEKGPVKVRLEYAKDPKDPNAWVVSSGRMTVGDKRLDLSKAELQLSAPLKPGSTPGELVNEEKVKTPVGTFDCKHYQKVIQTDQGPLAVHLWMSDEAGPTGLVKSWAPIKGVEVLLTKRGGPKPSKKP